MKHLFFLFVACLFTVQQNSSYAQTRVIEPGTESPSSAHLYYENMGQIADDSGNTHPEVLYYTEHTNPSIYLGSNEAYFVARKKGTDTSSDSAYRITMKFKCPNYEEKPCGKIASYDPGRDTLNYYLPHCPSGITGVTGKSGVVYQDVFTQTDFHFYSNNSGLKNFIRFKPGADPADFVLKFSGQDSIVAIDSIVSVYVAAHLFTLPIVDAYQVDNSNNITPLSWTPHWVSLGNGEVGINTERYDNTQDLIIRIGVSSPLAAAANGNMDWGTYYGGSGTEGEPVICANSANDVYHAMTIAGGSFAKKDGPGGARQQVPLAAVTLTFQKLSETQILR